MKPTIYITGNDSLPTEQLRKLLQEAETKIRARLPHAAIINPLKLGIPAGWSTRERLELRLKIMRTANAVVFLKDWIKGPYSKQEYLEAHNAGKDVFLICQLDMLTNEYGHLVS